MHYSARYYLLSRDLSTLLSSQRFVFYKILSGQKTLFNDILKINPLSDLCAKSNLSCSARYYLLSRDLSTLLSSQRFVFYKILSGQKTLFNDILKINPLSDLCAKSNLSCSARYYSLSRNLSNLLSSLRCVFTKSCLVKKNLFNDIFKINPLSNLCAKSNLSCSARYYSLSSNLSTLLSSQRCVFTKSCLVKKTLFNYIFKINPLSDLCAKSNLSCSAVYYSLGRDLSTQEITFYSHNG